MNLTPAFTLLMAQAPEDEVLFLGVGLLQDSELVTEFNQKIPEMRREDQTWENLGWGKA